MTVSDLGITPEEFTRRVLFFSGDLSVSDADCAAILEQVAPAPDFAADMKVDLAVFNVGHQLIGAPVFPRTLEQRVDELARIQAYRAAYPEVK